MQLRVEIIKDLEGFGALEAAWNPLLDRSGAGSIFLTYEWFSSCYAYFCHNCQLFIVVVRKEEAIVAIAPLMIIKKDDFRQLCMISNHIQASDDVDFIIDDSVNREQVIREMFDALDLDEGWDFFRLGRFSTDSVNFFAFNSVLARYTSSRVVRKEDLPTLYVPIKGTFDDYFQGLKKPFRKDIARIQRHLEKDVSSHSFSDEIDPEKVSETIGEIIDSKTESLKSDKYGGNWTMFDDLSTRPFFVDFAKKTYQLGWLKVSTLFINEEVASRFLIFQYNNICYGFISYYRPEYSSYSPSRLLHIRLIKQCFEMGLNEHSFLNGSDAYKFQYNVKTRDRYEISLFRGGLKGYFVRRRVTGVRIRVLEQMLRIYWWCGAKLRRILYMNHMIDAVKKILKRY